MNAPFISEKWRNITISGRVASGSTTLSKSLADVLGWTLFNGGELYREYVKKHSIPLERTTHVSDAYHLELDRHIQNKLRTEHNLIIESWLAGYDAKGTDKVFKIFVTCPDDAIRIDRIVNRDTMTVDQAKEHLRVREEENLVKWEKLYKTRDFWNPHLYDLVVDTYKNGPTQTLNIALEALGYKKT